MRNTVAELRDVELSEVEAAIGARSYARGRGYARNKVLAIEWDAKEETLTGSVVGHGALYDTAAYFTPDPAGALSFDEGECTCPIGHNCKHVAAIVMAALDAPAPPAAGNPLAIQLALHATVGSRSAPC